MDLKELENGVDPKTHWYYQSKKVPMMRFFKKLAKNTNQPITVIDFGAGSGFFGIELLNDFPSLVKEVLLIDINYTDEEIRESAGQKIKKLLVVPEGISNAVVLMMDVLEHVPDDGAVLKELSDKLNQDCWYFITVPAFMSLWSGHDVFLGHYRRYTRKMLTTRLNEQSFHLDHQYYIYGAIFPLVWIFRKLSNLQKKNDPPASNMNKTSPVINGLLKWFNIFEMNFRKANIFFGVTCVAEGKIK